MSGYTRQQSYIDGDVILAEHTNDEFDLLAEVFDTSLGHRHDGTTAEGPTIDLLSDDDGDTKIQVEEGADDDTIRFDTAATERLTIDGTGQFTANGTFQWNGNTTLNGNTTITGNVLGTPIYTVRPAFNGGTSGVDSPFTVDSTFKVTNLNADLFDDLNSTQFLRSDISTTFTGSDFTATAATGRFNQLAVTASNASILLDGDPGTGFGPNVAGPVRRITCNDGGGNFNIRSGSYFNVSEKYTNTGDGAVQIRMDNEGTGGSIRLKTATPGTADATITYANDLLMTSTVGDITLNGGKIWHAGNDGIASGLDADLLQGINGANYARTDINETFNGDIIISGAGSQFIGQSGLEGPTVPSYTWSGQQAKAGMYLVADNTIGFATAATERFRVAPGGQLQLVTLSSATTPDISFTSDTNTGIFRPGPDALSISTGGVESFRVNSLGQAVVGDGTAALPSFAFFNDGDCGMYRPDGNTIAFSTAAVERLRISSGGEVGIGEASPDAIFHVNDGATTGTHVAGIFGGGSSGTLNDECQVRISTSPGNADLRGIWLSAKNTTGAGQGHSLLIYTNPSSTTPVERARFLESGQFYIGTTTALFSATTGSGINLQPNQVSVFARNDGNTVFTTNQTDYVSGTVNHHTFAENGTTRGSITTNGSAAAYNTTSDYRLKENIVDLTKATSRLKDLPVHRFNFIGREETVDGFIAHEVQAVVPEAVTGEKDAVETDGTPIFQQMDASKLVPLLTAALKETTEKLENVVGRLAELEVRIQELESK